jgi:pimeloyl-ACP methyl ester carboxylesterase
MSASRIDIGPIELCYETFGEGEPLVLIMGLGAQMVQWDDDFCRALAGRGFLVIRFDNRDIGHSTRFDHLGVPPLRKLMMRHALGARIDAPYTLRDMAGDVAGLLTALGHARAHVVGASMGGMIAQMLAIEHPERVQSLTSMMSHCGDRWSGMPTSRGLRALMKPTPSSREQAEASMVEFIRTVGSTGFPIDEASVRHRAGVAYDRGLSPGGFARQFVAVMAATDRRAALTNVRVPALVVHGSVDPLVRVRAAHRLADALPSAELLVIEGMGHDVPRMAWPQIVSAIERTAERG